MALVTNQFADEVSQLLRKFDFLAEHVIHRKDDYAVQDDKGNYRRVGKELTTLDVINHLQGKRTIGVYQSSYPECTCNWIVYDIDDHGNGLAQVQRRLIKEAMIEHKVPFYVELSGTPGSEHVWVFLEKPVKVDIAYNFARWIIVESGMYLFSDEIFPKQDRLSEEKPFGNLIKVPFGVNQKNGNWSVFVDDVSGGIKTIDISGWVKKKLPKTKSQKPEKKEGSLLSSIPSDISYSIGVVAGCRGVRPCIQHIIDSQMPLRHYAGHRLRIAMATDLLKAGVSESDTAKVFRNQMDYDYGKSLYQVQSLRGYNRPSCETIIRNCESLFAETGFDINSVCQTCILRTEDENHEWGKTPYNQS